MISLLKILKEIKIEPSYLSKEALFQEWREGELKVDNEDLINILKFDDLKGENLDVFNNFLDLVKKYPKINREDLAILNSIGLFNYGAEWEEFDGNWNSLDEKTFNKIMKNEFGEEDDEMYD